jgi:DUF1365 family protein
MKSKIYNGFVEHTRYQPTYHSFQYPVYMYGLDLDELEQLDKKLPFFGYNRMRPASIHDADYLDQQPGSLREKLFRFLPDPVKENVESVMLVTAARYFHYVFNPVSFYYCFDHLGEAIQVVVEVSNTFGERHVYVPEKNNFVPGEKPGEKKIRFSAEKAFHVSPFNDMQGRYEFLFSYPENEIDVQIALIKEDEKIFEARLRGKGRELTRTRHTAMMLRHPVMPHLTKPRIVFEALRLYHRKHLAWHDKPPPSDPMTIRRK